MFTRVLQRYVASTVFSVPNLSEGADSFSGQTLRNKECPFSGVTSSGRVLRKVPESEARSVRKCDQNLYLFSQPAGFRLSKSIASELAES